MRWQAMTPMLIVIVAATVGSKSFTAGAESVRREDIVERMRHREQLVNSAYAEFSVDPRPTTPEMLAAIKEVCRRDGHPELYSRYEATEQLCQANRTYTKWWRKGVKERRETYPLSDMGILTGTTAYDGRLVRTVAPPNGMIATVETADWNRMNRIHPFSLVFQYDNVPYSDLLQSAKEWSIERIGDKDAARVRVRFHHPTLQSRQFVLLFDGEFRLLERQSIGKMVDDRQPRLHERHAFSAYQRYTLESGETIDFPTRAEYSYYMGVSDRGENVEYERKVINVPKIEFNKEIPDDLFVLAFPSDVKVFDRVHNLGWLESGVDPENPLATRSSAGRIALAVLAALALLLAAFVVGRRAIRARA